MLVIMSLFSFFLIGSRIYITGRLHFVFLVWNLFLAFIPWAITTALVLNPAAGQRKWLITGAAMLWLLFFPNSPYIFTDLFHLRDARTAPRWYDLIMILTFAWTGLIYGFQSLRDLEKLLRQWFHPKLIQASIVFVLFLSSFGVYLGRYLRWNSWDILRYPTKLLGDVADRLIHPMDHPATWGMTVLMGVLLNIMYWSLHVLRQDRTPAELKA